MTKPRYHSYAWALHLSVANRHPWQLSEPGHRGLAWARELAEQHREYARAGRERDNENPRLTVEDLAMRSTREDYPASRATIYRCIAQARRELFGSISMSAIYQRERRRKGRQPPRECAEPGCENWPVLRKVGRQGTGPWPRYCAEHATPTARVRRHRRSLA